MTAIKYKLGCKLVEHEPLLRFGDYFDPSVKLPTPPKEFGHETLVSDWGVLGNDVAGDCAIAGPYHAVMLWNAEAKRTVNVTTQTALQTYSGLTGYNPNDPDTDQGTDPHVVALEWQRRGLPDADGNLHKIGAFIDLTPGSLTELWLAAWLFDGVGVCIQMPSQWMDSFEAGKPWRALSSPDIEGGHYILGVSRRNGNLGIVTWGQVAYMTPGAYQQSNVRSIAYLSEEKLTNGVDLEGFDLSQLRADLRALPKAA